MEIDQLSGFLVFGVKDDEVNVVALRADDVTHSLMVINHEHHEIHEGTTFRYSDSLIMASAATQVYLITTPNTTKWAHFTLDIDGSAITAVDVYEGSDRSGTTLQTAYNANRNSNNINTTIIHKDISGGTTDGTKIYGYKSGSSSNQSRSAAIVDHDSEVVLKQNTKYLVRITSGTTDNLVNVLFNWYEHTSLTS